MPWFAYAIISTLSGAAFALLARNLTVNSANPRAFSVIFGIWAAFFSILLFIVDPFYFKALPLHIILLTILITILYAIHDRTQFYASKLVEASTLTLIWQLIPVVGFITALIFLHESFTLQKFIALLLIVGGNLLVIYKHPLLRANKGMVYAFIATVAVGIAIGINKGVSAGYSLPLYSAIAFFFPSVYNAVLPPLPPKTIAKELKLAGLGIILLAAINVLQFYSNLLAYRLTDASKVIPITASTTILVVMSGIIFLGERTQIKKKLIAVVGVFVGIVLISI